MAALVFALLFLNMPPPALAAASASAATVAPATLPTSPAALEEPPLSRLEERYRSRSGTVLRQFGYALFRKVPVARTLPLENVPDTYHLEPGDRLRVTLPGQNPPVQLVDVDAGGQMFVPGLQRPFMAAGRPLAAVRADLAAAARENLRIPEILVSLAEIRPIRVLVLGEVRLPGKQELPALASVMDALVAAGGILPEGSLRHLRLVRNNAESTLDLYDLLLNGSGSADVLLRTGDRIMVPPVGPVVALAGEVKRPGLYELPPSGSLMLRDAAAQLAGGLLRPGARRWLRSGIGVDGQESTLRVDDDYIVMDGDVLVVAPLQEQQVDTVFLEGHVRHPGPRPWRPAMTLDQILRKADLLPDPYPLLAVRLFRDSPTGNRTAVAVPLQAALEGRPPFPLTDQDTLVVFSEADVDFLTSLPVLERLAGRQRTQGPSPPSLASAASLDALVDCPGLARLETILAASPNGSLASGMLAQAARSLLAQTPERTAVVPRACPAVFQRYPELLPFALENAAYVRSGVLRPGFYPLAGQVSAAALRESAGRLAPAGPDGAAGRAATASHRQPVETLPASGSGLWFGKGMILDGEPPVVTLSGTAVRDPGQRLLARHPRLRGLLTSSPGLLLPTLYPHFAALVRFDPRTLRQTWIPFAPQAVIAGRSDLRLRDQDQIHVFSHAEVAAVMATLPSPVPEAPPAAEPPPVPVSSASPGVGDLKRDAPARGIEAGPAVLPPPPLQALMREHAAFLHGAVRQPGAYPLAGPVALTDLMATAGGPTRDAALERIEVRHRDGTSPALDLRPRPDGQELPEKPGHREVTGEVMAGDAIRIPFQPAQMEPGGIRLAGEVLHPGFYSLHKGERLSGVLRRAGGLTREAFPDGAVFTRASLRQRERDHFRQTARELEQGLTAALRSGSPPRAEDVALTRQLANELRAVEPLGRLNLEADPERLVQHPERDLLLEAGDALFIPKRPSWVAVAGEVLSPATLRFESGQSPHAYIQAAGGFSRHADGNRSFLLLPDGSARPLSASFQTFEAVPVPPGSTVVVPRDPDPFSFTDLSRGLTGILSQLAIAMASVSVILDR